MCSPPRSHFLGGRALIGAATRLRQSDALDQEERSVPRANSSANVVSRAPLVLVSVGPVLAVEASQTAGEGSASGLRRRAGRHAGPADGGPGGVVSVGREA